VNQIPAQSWEELNQASLTAALDELRAALAKLAELAEQRQMPGEITSPEPTPVNDRSSLGPPPALEVLCATFGLSSFERKILLMCAAAELDSRFTRLYAALNKDQRISLPTFSLAMAAFEDAHWSALLPARPLRHWRLIELLSGDVLTTSPLHIDESVLHFLTGMRSVDERVRSLIEPVAATGALPPGEARGARQIADRLARGKGQSSWPLIQLSGSEPARRRTVAAAACASLGLNLHRLTVAGMTRSSAEIDLFVRLWEREAALYPSGLLVEFDDLYNPDGAGDSALIRLVETMRSPVLVSVHERMKPVNRQVLSVELARATSGEQIDLWYRALGEAAPALEGEVETLVSHFSLSATDIDAAVAEAGIDAEPLDASEGNGMAAHSVADLAPALWDACRKQSRLRLEGLAQRIDPAATWNDLVLPEKQKQLLAQIAVHLRHRARVYGSWGFASKSSRGLGISALFCGPSGTGKTMAGEVLANELRLDLYRIDLSQVISKYIGETEKNLRRVFDAADDGAAILLFDEADALFGKRSEVKDSHDRYANIEVSYLLQRMEAYRGLAILTTNRKEALDTAFLRRIRFAVEFPFPESAQRAEIWRRVFPRQTPTEGLRIDRLARLNAAGGNIHNIAMGAAFLAADAGEPVRMSHLLSAARNEFSKIERPLTDLEIAGWV
jgi:AAA+ superfamily predicted ATPase